jgi:hypothetical protein
MCMGRHIMHCRALSRDWSYREVVDAIGRGATQIFRLESRIGRHGAVKAAKRALPGTDCF